MREIRTRNSKIGTVRGSCIGCGNIQMEIKHQRDVSDIPTLMPFYVQTLVPRELS